MSTTVEYGWKRHLDRSEDPEHVVYAIDTFPEFVTRESVLHIAHMQHRIYADRGARLWFKWSDQWRLKHGHTLERTLVQISNPNVGSNSWALDSYPA
jgi:hypothetical protein